MLSKGSVKKPYTVIVGLILILILGVVSFRRMTMDLLPDINLPYVLVVTTYPGASPLQVEETVTRPVEQSMATVSNFQNVKSTSSENVSMVVMQFSQNSDMDSVSLEIMEKLDQVKGAWPDSVGSPMIIKINPDMIPVYIAAVEKDGMDSYELNKYVKSEISNDFEAVEGVASVEISGGVEQYVSVVLKKDKIDELNAKIKESVENKFKEGEDKITDAEKEIEDAQKELDEGREKYDEGKESAAEQMKAAEGEITNGQNELNSLEAELKSQLAVAQAKIPDLEAQREQLAGEITILETAIEEIRKVSERIDEVEAQISELNESIRKLRELLDSETLKIIVELQERIRALEERLPDLTEEEQQQLEEFRARMEEYAAQFSEQYGFIFTTESDIREQIEELIANYEALRDSLTELRDSLNEEWEKSSNTIDELESTVSGLRSALSAVDSGIVQLRAAADQMSAALSQVAAGKITLSEAVAELNTQELQGIIEMAEAAAGITVGDAQLESARKELETAKENLKTQKELALDQADIRSRLTLQNITQVLSAQNFSMPAGYVSEDNVRYLIKVGDKAKTLEELEDTVLSDPGLEDMDPIRLKDVAEVVLTDDSDEVYASLNGQDAVLLSMQKQTGYSTGEVTDRINALIASLSASDPDLHITALMDQGKYIDVVVSSVLQNLLFGAILAVIVLFIFLKDIRPTLVVAVSIPMSVLVALVLMYFSGVTLNIISLSGLALGVGMLVDNSIVVIENIYRLRTLGMPVKKAAVQGARQMTGAIIASTLTTVCVYLPIVFTSGMARQLFSDLALTITYSLLASLFIALSFIPMAASGLLRGYVTRRSTVFSKISGGYVRLLRAALRRKALVLIVVAVLLAVSVLLVSVKGMIYFPEMESTQATVTMSMNDENATLKEAGEMADEVSRRLESIEDITDVGAMISSEGTMNLLLSTNNNDPNAVNLYLILDKNKKQPVKEIEKEIYEKTADLPVTLDVKMNNIDLSLLSGSGITLYLKGRDLDVLSGLAEDLGNKIAMIDGVEAVDNGISGTTGELRITVDKEKAAEYDLMVYQVFQLINEKISEAQGTSTLSTDTDDYDIVIYDESHEDYTRQDIRDMKINVTDKEGKTKEIPLSDIVTFEDGSGLDTIRRVDQSRSMKINATIEDDANITLVSDAVNAMLEQYELPEGYTYEMSGEDQMIRDSFKDMILMIVLGMIFMYLIMVAQFQSFKSPFIVMFTVPLAFTGGFLGLLFAGMNLSIIALLGFMLLVGVIVNNGIVLVDYINQLRLAGMEKREAIIKAGETRMRPIIMTALTTILGLLVMALGVGMGSDMVQPMAVVTIGGLAYGTFMTLFVVPCIYDALNRKEMKAVTDEELAATDEDLEIMKETNYL